MKHKMVKRGIIFILILIAVVKVIPAIWVSALYKENVSQGIKKYDLRDAVSYLVGQTSEKSSFIFTPSSVLPYVIQGREYTVQIAKKDAYEAPYIIEWGIGEQLQREEIHENKLLSFSFTEEGDNSCKIKIYQDEEMVGEWENTISYIIPYQKQFLDELDMQGVDDNFIWMDVNRELDMLNSLGSRFIRTDIRWNQIEENGYILYDRTIPPIANAGYKIMGILGSPGNKLLGSDGKVSSDEELQKFLAYAKGVIERYPQIKYYEVLNEPNGIYTTDEDFEWYVKMVKGVQEIAKKQDNTIKIIAGVTVNPIPEQDSRLPSTTFISEIEKREVDKVSDAYSYHLYDLNLKGKLNPWLDRTTKKHNTLYREIGGFTRNYVTEFGLETKTNGQNLQEQAKLVVRQFNQLKEKGVDLSTVFTLRDLGGTTWGLCTFDSKPKPGYFALKNYYEKVNGAEYIGTHSLADGLETHVYNKEGKPLIIAWAKNTDEPVEINVSGLQVLDIYGKQITSNNNKIVVTDSPVYLMNGKSSYFYQTISENLVRKYDEFLNCHQELSNSSEIQKKIGELKDVANQISKISSGITQESAENLLKAHYQVGNKLIGLYRNKQLNSTPVELSSLLDGIDEIGEIWVSLLTISTQKNTANLQKTQEQYRQAKEKIEMAEGERRRYPERILEYAEEYLEIAKYIDNLEEENPIKAGMIVSRNLHAELLSNWANEFITALMMQYFTENPITIQYDKTEWTNQDVTVTLDKKDSMTILNNEGRNQYTFSENGEFIFSYIRRGYSFTITAKVDWIDKTYPVILGVTENEMYIGKVIPQVEDENLESVTLLMDGQPVADYTLGNAITTEGIYELVATDKAGNTTKVSFQVIEKLETEYQVKENAITNISYQTTRKEFEKRLNTTATYRIYREDRELEEKDIIATGDILKTSTGDNYILVITGDMNKDGNLTIADLILLRRRLLNLEEFDEAQTLAADTNHDEKEIGIKDLVRLRILLLNKNT